MEPPRRTPIPVRAGKPNFTLVMLDGIPLNDITNLLGGSFYLAGMSPDNIEQVEILRGRSHGDRPLPPRDVILLSGPAPSKHDRTAIRLIWIVPPMQAGCRQASPIPRGRNR